MIQELIDEAADSELSRGTCFEVHLIDGLPNHVRNTSLRKFLRDWSHLDGCPTQEELGSRICQVSWLGIIHNDGVLLSEVPWFPW